MRGPLSATARVRAAVVAGDLKGALKITSGWRPSSLVSRENLRILVLGYECLIRPDFYRSIGRDPEAEIDKAKDVLIAVFFKEEIDAAQNQRPE